MGVCLAADDIQVGAYVAVHSVLCPARRRRDDAPVDEHTLAPVPPGIPLQVLATSFPFVACGVIEPGGGVNGPVLLDLRSIKLCKLNDDYVQAIASFVAHDCGDVMDDREIDSLHDDYEENAEEKQNG